MDIHSLISTWRSHYQQRPQRQKTILKFMGIILALILLFLLKCCTALSMHKKTSSTPLLIRENNQITIPAGSPLRSQMQVQTVQRTNTPHTVVLPGIVEGNQVGNLDILPPVSGHLIQLKVALGEEVSKDQVLAVIESAGLAQAYSDKVKAQSALKQAQEAVNRAQKVNRAGANAIKDIEQLQNNFTQAQAELQRAQVALASIGGTQDNPLQIQAPMGGKITSLNYGLGSYINDVTQPLLTLSNIKSVWVTLCVPENLIAVISKGQNAQISLAAYPQRTWSGKISFTNHLVDPDTRCNKSRIALDNADEKLQPNMFASVRTQIPQSEQIIIPLSAILMENNHTTVFVESAPWVFQRRVVVLGAEDQEQVRISAGLQAGDRIVTAGGILVND